MRTALLMASLAPLLAAACGGAGDSATEGKLRVVTSLGIFADFVRQVGGEGVDVTAVIPPGADPETFEPAPSDIRRVAQADVVFINGGGLESAFEDVIENNAPGTVVRFGDLFEGENPHFWLSLDNASVYARAVADALADADPPGAAAYGASLEAYDRELDALAGDMKAAITFVPPERRKLVTAHDAFPYLAEYLGLELVGFVAPTEAQEPSPGDVQKLITAISEQGVPAVFAEPGFRDATLEQVADETGVRVCTLYSDALDDRVTTYVEMMRFNLGELARCLGGADGG